MRSAPGPQYLPPQASFRTGMTIELFNTLTNSVEELRPSDGPLRMYACGPTVYDYGHIGNFRTFLQVDVLRRFLKLQGVPSPPRDEHHRR